MGQAVSNSSCCRQRPDVSFEVGGDETTVSSDSANGGFVRSHSSDVVPPSEENATAAAAKLTAPALASKAGDAESESAKSTAPPSSDMHRGISDRTSSEALPSDPGSTPTAGSEASPQQQEQQQQQTSRSDAKVAIAAPPAVAKTPAPTPAAPRHVQPADESGAMAASESEDTPKSAPKAHPKPKARATVKSKAKAKAKAAEGTSPTLAKAPGGFKEGEKTDGLPAPRPVQSRSKSPAKPQLPTQPRAASMYETDKASRPEPKASRPESKAGAPPPATRAAARAEAAAAAAAAAAAPAPATRAAEAAALRSKSPASQSAAQSRASSKSELSIKPEAKTAAPQSRAAAAAPPKAAPKQAPDAQPAALSRSTTPNSSRLHVSRSSSKISEMPEGQPQQSPPAKRVVSAGGADVPRTTSPRHSQQQAPSGAVPVGYTPLPSTTSTAAEQAAVAARAAEAAAQAAAAAAAAAARARDVTRDDVDREVAQCASTGQPPPRWVVDWVRSHEPSLWANASEPETPMSVNSFGMDRLQPSRAGSGSDSPSSSRPRTRCLKLQVFLGDSWVDVPGKEFRQIRDLLRAGELRFNIQARKNTYIIDFTDPENPTQTNLKTGTKRKLRILNPQSREEETPRQPAAYTRAAAHAALSPTNLVGGGGNFPFHQRGGHAAGADAAAGSMASAIANAEMSDAHSEYSSYSLSSRIPSKRPTSEVRSAGPPEHGAGPDSAAGRMQEMQQVDNALSPKRHDATPKRHSARMHVDTQTQLQYGPQSKRGQAVQYQLSVLSNNEHAKICFEEFALNEEKYCGEWAVFYHSYSYSALLYELQAAVGAVLFRFRSQYAPLPRILVREFEDTPDAPSLIRKFNTKFYKDQKDHHPEYRAVGLSVMCSLVALGPEASPPVAFNSGYSQRDLKFRSVLEDFLKSCEVDKLRIKRLADEIIELSQRHGLDVSQFGGQPCKSGKAGHLLQIFMRRDILDQYTYAAQPWGAEDKERMPISQWLNADSNTVYGQARIVAHPTVFMQANSVRMFVASADPTFHENRSNYQEELTALMKSVVGDPGTRERAATSIYGGALPDWWTNEDQRRKSRSASRPPSRHRRP